MSLLAPCFALSAFPGTKKSGPVGPLSIERLSVSVLETLLGKTGARSGALAGLELRVGLADHVDGALALHDLTVGVAALGGGEGRQNFHGGKSWWGARNYRDRPECKGISRSGSRNPPFSGVCPGFGLLPACPWDRLGL